MRVLVVDDNPTVRTTARILLEDAGLTVFEADGGVAALRAVRGEDPDIVLCDVFMPDIDGLEVIRALRRDFPNAKVIAMSGGAFGGALDLLPAARRLGASGVLQKPFTQQMVLEEIERVLPSPTVADRCLPGM